MKKITNTVLVFIGLAGTYLVGQGIITGEELGNIQNVIGMALGGGALSIGMIMAIIRALPNQLVSAGYDKAVEKYGQSAVDNFVGKIDVVVQSQNKLIEVTNEVKNLLVEAKELRESLLNE